MTIADTSQQTLSPRIADALGYEAPYLIEKLIKNCVVETAAEGEELFLEVKRYLVLCNLDQDRVWSMYSLRVDETWHQFILFTRQYTDFCQSFFGRYIPHSPSNAPEVESARPVEKTSFAQFCARYQEVFSEPLPDVWFDENSVTLDRRLFSRWSGPLTVHAAADTVELLNSDGDSLFAVNDVAREAIEFIARTGAFYVRELPGGLHDEEKVALASTLVACKVLRAAS
ncbi:glycine-rich domain-containing protein [Nocardia tengchongensis]|uniref:glycine-rich domain-containing protein n=1 Tax=Nocardia tengchongensis TaxID=2055889 RepID=UPI00364FDC05